MTKGDIVKEHYNQTWGTYDSTQFLSVVQAPVSDVVIWATGFSIIKINNDSNMKVGWVHVKGLEERLMSEQTWLLT